MSADRQWVDICMLHALACVFQVDVVVFQQDGNDPAYVGCSIHNGRSATTVVPICLLNDFHYWGLLPLMQHSEGCFNEEDWARQAAERLSAGTSVRKGDSHSEEDEIDDSYVGLSAEVANMNVIDMSHWQLPDAEVEAELNLCRCLRLWQPWERPSDELVPLFAKKQIIIYIPSVAGTLLKFNLITYNMCVHVFADGGDVSESY